MTAPLTTVAKLCCPFLNSYSLRFKMPPHVVYYQRFIQKKPSGFPTANSLSMLY